MTKKSEPKAKKPRAKSKKDVPLLTPLDGALCCECGCGRVADATDWDTNAPLSWNCLLERAKVVDVSPP